MESDQFFSLPNLPYPINDENGFILKKRTNPLPLRENSHSMNSDDFQDKSINETYNNTESSYNTETNTRYVDDFSQVFPNNKFGGLFFKQSLNQIGFYGLPQISQILTNKLPSNIRINNKINNESDKILDEQIFSSSNFNYNYTYNKYNKYNNYNNNNFQSEKFLAICVRSLKISYGQNDKCVNILNGVNMSVRIGDIYSLLGPSGCGKTTLLRTIIGSFKLTTGSVRLFGYTTPSKYINIPGSEIGYMPQDVSLYSDLTINEMLLYFGRIYSIPIHKLLSRIDYLIEIMELPSDIIRNLSLGTQRRLSFACALIHKPLLLILDEPTVGVDPILRERIWEILEHFSLQGMTILITTHYIEETRRSTRVGFMRRGVILEEDSPDILIKRYDAKGLEDVFYKLCVAQKRQSVLWKRTSTKRQLYKDACTRTRESIHNDIYYNVKGKLFDDKNLKECDHFKSEKSSSSWFKILYAVTKRIMTQSLRQPTAIFAQFFLPVISLILFGLCIGRTPIDIPLGIINQDPLGQSYLNHLTPIVKLINHTSLEDALESVKKTSLMGVLYIGPNFTDSLISRIELYNNYNDFNSKSLIILYADLTNKVLFVTLYRALHEALENYINELAKESDYDVNILDTPIKVMDTIYGVYRKGDYFAVRNYGTPGTLVILTYTVAFGLTIMVLSVERSDSLMERNMIAGISTIQIILGHLIARIIFMSGNVMILFGVALYLFDVPMRGNPLIACCLLLMISISGLAHGMMISAMCPSFFNAAVLSNGILLIMFILSGALWPIESLPSLLKSISYFSPTTLPTEALRSILSRGYGIKERNVWLGFLVTFGWLIIFGILAIIMFRQVGRKLK